MVQLFKICGQACLAKPYTDSITSFEKFRVEIARQIGYDQTKASNLLLSYNDDEGDRIRITSDPELKEFFSVTQSLETVEILVEGPGLPALPPFQKQPQPSVQLFPLPKQPPQLSANLNICASNSNNNSNNSISSEDHSKTMSRIEDLETKFSTILSVSPQKGTEIKQTDDLKEILNRVSCLESKFDQLLSVQTLSKSTVPVTIKEEEKKQEPQVQPQIQPQVQPQIQPQVQPKIQPQVQPQKKHDLASPYLAELQALNDMGFRDNEKNLLLLYRFKGNLDAVISSLLK